MVKSTKSTSTSLALELDSKCCVNTALNSPDQQAALTSGFKQVSAHDGNHLNQSFDQDFYLKAS